MNIIWQGTVYAAIAALPLALLSLFHYARYLKKVGFQGRLPLLFRACAWILALLFLSGFTVMFTKNVPVRGKLAIILDSSQSMRMKDGTEKERFARAISDIEKFIKSRGTDDDVYIVSEELKKSDIAEIKTLKFTGAKTFISDNIEKIAAEEDFSDILIFTDGNETSGINSGGFKTGAHIHAMTYGKADNPQNSGVSDVRAPEFGIVDTENIVSAEIYYSGVRTGESIGVELFENDKRAGQEVLKSTGPDFTGAKIDFKYTPKLVGEKTLTVKIKTSSDEHEVADNSRVAFMDVISDKKSALYIDSPGWDFRFLSEFLKNLEKIDYKYVLMGPGGALDGKELRTGISDSKALSKYRLLIVGNAADYLTSKETDAILKYVEAGGNLVILGGDRSLFKSGGRWPEALGKSTFQGDRDGFEVTLTKNGKNSPLLNVDQNGECWKKFQFIKSFNKLTSLSGAEALAVHPWLKCGAGPCPLIFTKAIGRGNIISFAFQSQWRWRFSDATAECYDVMWKNIITETAGAEKKPAIQIFTGKKIVPIGENVNININVNDAAVKGTLKLRMIHGDKEEIISEMEIEPDVSKYGVTYAPPDEGIYEFVAEFNGAASEAANIYAHLSRSEYKQAGKSMRFEDAVVKNGGKVFEEGQVGAAIKYFKENTEYVKASAPYRPWTKWAFLIAIIFFLTMEWIVRRRGGLT